MDSKLLRDRRVMIAAVAGVLVLSVGLGAAFLARSHRQPSSASTRPAGSLQVEMGRQDGGLDASRPLRCFAGGRFIGMTSLQDCAHRNGVAPGGLDVGLDPTGAVAATTPDAAVLQPLPGAPSPPALQGDAAPPPEPDAALAQAPPTQAATCWRFVGDWRKVADQMTLDACVQALFAGRCERPGGADYGRWDHDTLRLVTGRVERSSDNRTFRTLVKQRQEDCAIQSLQE